MGRLRRGDYRVLATGKTNAAGENASIHPMPGTTSWRRVTRLTSQLGKSGYLVGRCSKRGWPQPDHRTL